MHRLIATLVDAYGRLEAMADATKAAFDAVKAIEAELADETARVAAAQAEADFAAHAHQELTKLAVMPGEEEALAERRVADDAGRKSLRRHSRGL